MSFIDTEYEFPIQSCYIQRDQWDSNRDFDLSIIIPLYNSEQFLEQLMKSVLKQNTIYSYEVILIDDGSTDRTSKLIKPYLRQFPLKIKYITQFNTGISAARNSGICHSRGKYLCFMDHDDLISENFVQQMLQTAIKFNADIVRCSFQIQNQRKPGRGNYQSKQDEPISIIKQENLINCSGYIWAGIYSYSLFSNIQFPVSCWYEDIITRSLVLRLGKKIYSLNQSLYTKVEHNSNASKAVWKSNSLKSLDHLFLVETMIKDSEKLGLETNSQFFEIILQELTLYLPERVRFLNLRTKKSIFNYSCWIINTYFPSDLKLGLSKSGRKYLKIFKKKSFGLWLSHSLGSRLRIF